MISMYKLFLEDDDQDLSMKTTKYKPWMRGTPIPVGGKGPAPNLDLNPINPSPVDVSTQNRMSNTLTRQQYNGSLLAQRSAKNPRLLPPAQ